MVISDSPSRCDTAPRWLTRGIFNSVGWLPFLNCALAPPANTPSPTNKPKAHFHTLLIVTLSPFEENAQRMPPPEPASHSNSDRRLAKMRVSQRARNLACGSPQFNLNCSGFIETYSDSQMRTERFPCRIFH